MTEELRIVPMSTADLSVAVSWAADEGWNPGHEDAAAFHVVDPDGFLMGWIGNQPATAISVVRHSDTFGFLGFYLCHPEYRGKGFGWKTWQAGISHLGDRIIGLDGVPAQVQNYEKSGFTFAHQTKRFGGSVNGCPHPGYRRAETADLEGIISLDRDISAVDRMAYLSNWCSQTQHRTTMVHQRAGRIRSVGTIRACRHGHKIGPLFTPDAQTAQRMIEALVHQVRAEQIYIDVPDPNMAAQQLIQDLSLQSEFSCARMYRGHQIERDLTRNFGEVSFELG